jgi:putative membrane protein
LYSLAYAFEAVGEALAVILMVIQVAGSGGSFPIEVLPEPFQIMYNYMPFMHAMNALRECIAGFYGDDYWLYLSGLLPYVGIAIIIGVVLSKPCRGLLEKIDESKEKTELLI